MRLRSLLLLLVPLWLGTAHGQGLRKVPLLALHPSQMEIGGDAVHDTVTDWKSQAKSSGMSLAEYARTKLTDKFAHTEIEAVVAPNGDVLPTDGHHRISALIQIAHETGVEVPVRVKISADYRGQTQAQFAHDFFDVHGKGYFTRGVQKLSSEERLAKLPRTFAALRNSPMRSAMANLFTRLGLDDEALVDYAEFKVADWLIKRHVFTELQHAGLVMRGTSHLPEALVRDERVLAVMRHDLTTADGRAFMMELAADQRAKETIEKQLRE